MRINFYDTRLTDNGRVELVKEGGINHDAGKMDRPGNVALLAREILKLDRMAEEHVYMLSLDSSCKIIGVFLVAKGTVNAALTSPREIYIRALLSGAVMIILIHNHPSGRTTPTEDDRRLTERMRSAGELLSVKLVDHIIIGGGVDGTYLSFKEEGLL